MEHLQECELFIENREIISKAFQWEESSLLHLCAAAVYTLNGKKADAGTLQSCKKLLKEKTRLFSAFRGVMAVCQVSLSADREAAIENMMAVDRLMKKDFSPFTDLPYVAMSIALAVRPDQYGETVARTRRIYDKKNRGNLFADKTRDAGVCAMMAMSGRPEDAMLQDMRACHALLKERLSGVQARSLAPVLALYDGAPEEKTGRAVELLERLKDAGMKYDWNSDLSYLGVIAMSCTDIARQAGEMQEIDAWLAGQKGFRHFGTPASIRRMFAGLLSVCRCTDTAAIGNTVVDSVAAILAQQIATYIAIVSASTVITTTINHSNR